MKSIELSVVGLQYRVTPATLRKLKETLNGGPLRVSIEREADNVHDENAIKVVIAEPSHKGMHIGYLQRGVAATYARPMDSQSISLEGWLTDLDVEANTGQLAVRVRTQTKKKTQGKRAKRKA